MGKGSPYKSHVLMWVVMVVMVTITHKINNNKKKTHVHNQIKVKRKFFSFFSFFLFFFHPTLNNRIDQFFFFFFLHLSLIKYVFNLTRKGIYMTMQVSDYKRELHYIQECFLFYVFLFYVIIIFYVFCSSDTCQKKKKILGIAL